MSDDIRVSGLANEFSMTNAQALDWLKRLDISAKTHASKLSKEDAEKFRNAVNEKIEKDASMQSKKEKQQALDSQERKQRADKARAKRENDRASVPVPKAPAGKSAVPKPPVPKTSAGDAARETSARDEAQSGLTNANSQENSLTALEEQIINEKKRVSNEAAELEMRKKQELRASKVQKKQDVSKKLAESKSTSRIPSSSAEDAGSGKKPVKVLESSMENFNSLLSQIQNQENIVAPRNSKPAANSSHKKGGAASSRNAKGARRTDLSDDSTSSVPNYGFDALGNSITVETTTEDRYATMAQQAEKLQRDKVLEQARAVVAAANTDSGQGRRKKRKEKREAEERERLETEAIEKGLDPTLVLDDSVVEIIQGATVSKFAELLDVPANDVIKRLFMLGQALTLTQSMSDDLIELIADDMGRKVRVVSPEEEFAVVFNDSEEDLVTRPPVVTVMGHVDHGKTSLLDAIRQTGVVASEAGGITQHIGAHVTEVSGRTITFIDTPGHEAFTAMRARGAQVTDVIVLVVAADDGVMPQTVEAINHAKAANVPVVVAVNKIDKPGANAERVRTELSERGVIPEEWGGTNMFVEVSAKKDLHIEDLLETILLQADILELKANPNALASGFVIEANLDKGRGPVATMLVARGTLKPGDCVVAGVSYGRVRALINPDGGNAGEALPAAPVEVLGLNAVPVAGDEFRVFEDERDARKLAEERALRMRLAQHEAKSHMNLNDLFSRIEEGKLTDLNLIVKADVQGSIEALVDAFSKIDQSEVRINVVHSAVGGITETDVTLAAASDAIIIGFNVRPTGKSRILAEKEAVDIRLYRVIYQAIEDINAARVGLLSPDIIDQDTGIAEVRETFKVPKIGLIAGCYITEGEISRDDKVRVVRDGTVIFEGTIDSLRRFKDDVKSVRNGYECGIGVNGYQDIKVGDTIEGYRVVEVERVE